MVLVEVCLLEVAELGLQVLEVLCDALVLLSQPNVGLRILLLMLCILLLQIREVQSVSLLSMGNLYEGKKQRVLCCTHIC